MVRSHLNLPHHFTASGIVVDGEYILLVNHRRIGAWVPPGGHIEDTELPEETVIREIFEETGVRVEVLTPVLPNTGDAEAFFLASPLYVQTVLANEKGQQFYHIDLSYLCRVSPECIRDANGRPSVADNAEVKESRWVKISEVHNLPLAKNVAEALTLLQNPDTVRLLELSSL